MLVRYHMTREIHRFTPRDRAVDALRRMHADGFRFAPVVDAGRLVGVVTERDLVRILPGSVLAEVESDADDLRVARAMSPELVTIGPNVHVEDAARILFERKINGLPVVDEGTLLGVLTTSDILRTLMENEAALEGHRVTVLLPTFGPGVDLWAVCREHGLTVNTLWRHRARGGAFLATLRLGGPFEALEELFTDLRRRGVMLVEGFRPERKAG